jgi:hypothetical protein
LRQSTKLKLLLEVIAVAGSHIGILYIMYGRESLPPLHGWAPFVWLLLPSCGAFVLYYVSLSKADFISEPYRRVKLATSSLAATLFSLYWGVFFALNTYGS